VGTLLADSLLAVSFQVASSQTVPLVAGPRLTLLRNASQDSVAGSHCSTDRTIISHHKGSEVIAQREWAQMKIS